MSISYFPKEILNKIFMEIDSKDVYKLEYCSKEIIKFLEKNHFWKHRLIKDFPQVMEIKQNHHEYYKWQSSLPVNLNSFAEKMQDCKYLIDDQFQQILNELIIQVGPTIRVTTKDFESKLWESIAFEKELSTFITEAIFSSFGKDSQKIIERKMGMIEIKYQN